MELKQKGIMKESAGSTKHERAKFKMDQYLQEVTTCDKIDERWFKKLQIDIIKKEENIVENIQYAIQIILAADESIGEAKQGLLNQFKLNIAQIQRDLEKGKADFAKQENELKESQDNYDQYENSKRYYDEILLNIEKNIRDSFASLGHTKYHVNNVSLLNENSENLAYKEEILQVEIAIQSHIVRAIKDSSGWLQGSTGQKARELLFQEEKGDHKEYLKKLLSFYQILKDFDGRIDGMTSKELINLLDKKVADLQDIMAKNQKMNYLYKFRKLSSEALTLINGTKPDEGIEFYKECIKKFQLFYETYAYLDAKTQAQGKEAAQVFEQQCRDYAQQLDFVEAKLKEICDQPPTRKETALWHIRSAGLTPDQYAPIVQNLLGEMRKKQQKITSLQERLEEIQSRQMHTDPQLSGEISWEIGIVKEMFKSQDTLIDKLVQEENNLAIANSEKNQGAKHNIYGRLYNLINEYLENLQCASKDLNNLHMKLTGMAVVFPNDTHSTVCAKDIEYVNNQISPSDKNLLEKLKEKYDKRVTRLSGEKQSAPLELQSATDDSICFSQKWHMFFEAAHNDYLAKVPEIRDSSPHVLKSLSKANLIIAAFRAILKNNLDNKDIQTAKVGIDEIKTRLAQAWDRFLLAGEYARRGMNSPNPLQQNPLLKEHLRVLNGHIDILSEVLLEKLENEMLDNDRMLNRGCKGLEVQIFTHTEASKQWWLKREWGQFLQTPSWIGREATVVPVGVDPLTSKQVQDAYEAIDDANDQVLWWINPKGEAYERLSLIIDQVAKLKDQNQFLIYVDFIKKQNLALDQIKAAYKDITGYNLEIQIEDTEEEVSSQNEDNDDEMSDEEDEISDGKDENDDTEDEEDEEDDDIEDDNDEQ